MEFKFQGSPLVADVSAGLIMSNQSLVLQRVREGYGDNEDDDGDGDGVGVGNCDGDDIYIMMSVCLFVCNEKSSLFLEIFFWNFFFENLFFF